MRDFAETSRRDKPGWSRGIRPVIIHAPTSVFTPFRRDKAGFGFNSKGSAHASRAIRRAPRRISFPQRSRRGVANHTRGACASPSAIIKRPPLAPTARRAGWVGCNIALNRVPAEARILVVTESTVMPASEVREKFKRVKPLKDISVNQRGWTLDVLNAIRRLGKTAFTTADAYAFTRELEKLHPDNRHIKDKICQQLQVLRDLGMLLHVGRGIWRLP